MTKDTAKFKAVGRGMTKDRTNSARQSRYQAKKKAEFDALKLRVKEYESRSCCKEERERCAQYCETIYPVVGREIADSIRGLK